MGMAQDAVIMQQEVDIIASPIRPSMVSYAPANTKTSTFSEHYMIPHTPL